MCCLGCRDFSWISSGISSLITPAILLWILAFSLGFLQRFPRDSFWLFFPEFHHSIFRVSFSDCFWDSSRVLSRQDSLNNSSKYSFRNSSVSHSENFSRIPPRIFGIYPGILSAVSSEAPSLIPFEIPFFLNSFTEDCV